MVETTVKDNMILFNAVKTVVTPLIAYLGLWLIGH